MQEFRAHVVENADDAALEDAPSMGRALVCETHHFVARATIISYASLLGDAINVMVSRRAQPVLRTTSPNIFSKIFLDKAKESQQFLATIS